MGTRTGRETRATMAHLINEGMAGGETLRASWRAHAHLWDIEDRTVAAETHADGAMDIDIYSSSSTASCAQCARTTLVGDGHVGRQAD